MMKRAMLAAILAVAAAGTAAAAPPRQDVERLLSGYEPRVGRDDFQRLGEGVDRVLVAIAVDPGTSRIRRNRALAALAWVPSREGRALLERVIQEHGRDIEGPDLLDVCTAAKALAAFGAGIAPRLLPLVAHPSPDVRQAVAEALGQARAREALPSLRQRIAVERDPMVSEALRRAIAALQ